MPHSKQLIATISALVELDYPRAAGYQVVTEQRLKDKGLGRSVLMPDICVYQGQRAVCVVEIGYTRPEKLTAYREQLQIPDVRWYAKDGTLHADVREQVVSVSIDAQPAGSLFSYVAFGAVPCVGCPETDGPRRVPDRSYDRYIRRYGLDAYEARFNKTEEAESREVVTRVLTDYVAVWLLADCDACGKIWFVDREDGFYLIDVCRQNPRAISRDLNSKREEVSWRDASEMAQGFGLSLNYMDGHFLRDDAPARIHTESRALANAEATGRKP